MYKLVTFAGYDAHTGPHIFPIEADRERTIGHIKMARPLPSSIEQYIRTAKPIPGKTQLLIDAMGAGEFYGSNVNGDYFPEEALSHPGKDYGYETFMHYAYPYKHHVNKDPARAYGEKVRLSAYDPHMHRVLLIVVVDDMKCQDILGDLSKGHYWDVSMGCKVPWDECSICKNRARNRGEYCMHLRYQMNKILQDGRRVFAYNRLPKFFDISFVTIGAEKASHILSKVARANIGPEDRRPSAELGELYYAKLSAEEKRAIQKKRADIDKDVPSQPAANIRGATPEDKSKIESMMSDAGEIKALEPSMPPQTLDTLSQFPLQQIFSTLAALGIGLKPHEFQRIILIKQGAAELANALDKKRLVFDEAKPGAMPKWAKEMGQYDVRMVSEKVAMVLRPFIAERSCYPEILHSRLSRMEKRAELPFRYDRDSQWHPMTDEEKRKSSGINSLIPASMALAAGFLVFKNAFPGLVMKGPAPVRALAQHPWMIPMLLGAGIGASVWHSKMEEPMPFTSYGAGAGLDAKNSRAYHAKTANVAARVGLIPLMYMYAGLQQKRWRKGERLNAVDRLIAQRPDLASIAAFAAAPRVGKSIGNLVKRGSADKINGPELDADIAQSIRRIAGKKETARDS